MSTPIVPPPRRIDDILELLNQPGQFDSKITEEYKSVADSIVPKDADNKTLAKFYHERGFTAKELGRYEQALKDLRVYSDMPWRVSIVVKCSSFHRQGAFLPTAGKFPFTPQRTKHFLGTL